MNHENSQTDMMKSSTSHKPSEKETFMLDLYVNMMLQEALLKNEKEKILLQIDHSLDQKDRKSFLRYSKQLQEITKKFGT